MTVADMLARLAGGERPSRGKLLHTCRLEGWGTEFYGEEAILDAFRASPERLSDAPEVIETEMHVALFDGGMALIGDLFDGRLGRLWRLGGGDPVQREHAVSIAFDPDLSQERGDLWWRAEDHPHLPREAAPHVEAAGQAMAAASEPRTFRTRAFLIRAFAADGRGAALFALHRLGAQPVRSAGFSYAAVLFRYDGAKLLDRTTVLDISGEAATRQDVWKPRI